jgi:alpha-beta hydrolase superfamily lysophospholipase
MIRFAVSTVVQVVKAAAYSAAGASLVLLAIFVLYLQSRPDLKVWHEAELDAEFGEDAAVDSFADYLALEARLFAQLEERVYARIEPADRRLINRYHRGSLSDPQRWSTDWNRSFEFDAAEPRAGVLLLHGLSDSPYSLRNIGVRLHQSGAWVVGLRLPGHGTAPAALLDVRWEEMAAAVRLAAGHLRDRIGDRPLYIVGYSNGGALGVHYALSALEDPALPAVDRLVLISPAIGVSRMAALAVWQSRLGRLLGLHKLEWNAILPEYDPFKYGSFAVNAGDQVYRLTAEIRSRLDRLGRAGRLGEVPPLLAFQSIVDATVSTEALVSALFGKLPRNGNELVLFDVNRDAESEHLMVRDPRAVVDELLRAERLPFTFSLVTNEDAGSTRVAVLHKRVDGASWEAEPLPMAWPEGIYSLSHVALPFPGDDPVYGGMDHGESPGIQLGNIALRGERGTLQIPAADMLRLRWNPFYPYLEQRILDFLGLAVAAKQVVGQRDPRLARERP